MSTLHVAVVSWNLGGAEVDFGSVRRVADRLDVERMDVVCVVAQELHSLSLRARQPLLRRREGAPPRAWSRRGRRQYRSDCLTPEAIMRGLAEQLAR